MTNKNVNNTESFKNIETLSNTNFELLFSYLNWKSVHSIFTKKDKKNKFLGFNLSILADLNNFPFKIDNKDIILKYWYCPTVLIKVWTKLDSYLRKEYLLLDHSLQFEIWLTLEN